RLRPRAGGALARRLRARGDGNARSRARAGRRGQAHGINVARRPAAGGLGRERERQCARAGAGRPMTNESGERRSRLVGDGDISVSFELFPPKTEKMEEALWSAI